MSEINQSDALLTTVDTFGDDFGGERMWGLKELPASFDVSWLPQTDGWGVLLSAVLIMGLMYLYQRRQRWLALAYYRDALECVASMRRGDSPITQLPLLLKSCALKRFKREEVASLSGIAWVQWLNEQTEQPSFDERYATVFTALAYQKDTDLDQQLTDDLLDASELWLRRVHASV